MADEVSKAAAELYKRYDIERAAGMRSGSASIVLDRLMFLERWVCFELAALRLELQGRGKTNGVAGGSQA